MGKVNLYFIFSDLPGSHWKLCVQSTSKHVPMNAFVLQLFLLITSKNSENYSMKGIVRVTSINRVFIASTYQTCFINPTPLVVSYTIVNSLYSGRCGNSKS